MEEKYTYRFPPCSAWDLEGLESWLEDLAKQGLFLDKNPFFAGFATFRKGQPRAVRYRLQPIPKAKGLFQGNDPDMAALELAAEYGWEYLGNHWQFCIYTSEDPRARELDTDPAVQAMALNGLYKKERNNCLMNILSFLILAGIIVWAGPVSFLAGQPSGFLAILAVVWPVFFIQAAQELRHLKQLKQRLAAGEPLNRKKNWRKGRWSHWIRTICAVLLYIVTIIGLIWFRVVDWEDSRWQRTPDALPFATLEDLGTFTAHEKFIIDETDHTASRTSLLAARQIKLQQMGKLTIDGRDGSASLYVDYYQLRTDWLAKQMFRELHHLATLKKYYSAGACPDLPTEQEVLYYDHGAILLLQHGNTVMQVRMALFDDQTDLETWTGIFAESMVQ